jgi:hypothetical protein
MPAAPSPMMALTISCELGPGAGATRVKSSLSGSKRASPCWVPAQMCPWASSYSAETRSLGRLRGFCGSCVYLTAW